MALFFVAWKPVIEKNNPHIDSVIVAKTWMLTSRSVRKGQVSLLFIVEGNWQKEKTVAVKSEQRLVFFVFGFFHVG